MADVRFLTGKAASLPSSRTPGQIYFTVSEDKEGQIIFDTLQGDRVVMSSSEIESCYATCPTSGAIQQKIVMVQGDINWSLKVGNSIYIKFVETNFAFSPVFSIYRGGALLKESIPVYFNGERIFQTYLDHAGCANQILHFVYDGDAFHLVGGLGDEGTYQLNNKLYKVNSTFDLLAHNLVAQNENGLLVPATMASFLVGSPLYIINNAKLANSVGKSSDLYEKHSEILLLNQSSEIDGTPYAPVYLVGEITGSTFVPRQNSPFAFGLPKTADKYKYLYIGETTPTVTQNGNHSYINLNITHSIYEVDSKGESSLYGSSASVLKHTLTIGEQSFDGSEDVTVPVYSGNFIFQ